MKKLATLVVVLAVVSGVYAASYLALNPRGAGIRREPWFDVVERKSMAEAVCKAVYAPCVWVEWQLLVAENIGRAEGEWLTRDGKHALEIRRVWGNTFELSSRTGWIVEPIRVRGNSPGCGPMVMTDAQAADARVTLLPSATKAQMSVTVGRKRGVFSGPL